MNLRKMAKITVTSALAMCMVATPMVSKASDDNVDFNFDLKPKYGNTTTPSARYRQTTNVKNKWKVNLKNSTEGNGTIATFWLTTRKDGKNVVSDKTHDVAQGSGAHYYDAKSSASQKDVYLAAENNNDSTNTYEVSGYWDEETN